MLRNLFSALSGGLFGAGLLVSGMVDTTKVQGWLDVFGAWDPTLAFVLAGAVGVMALAWAVARHWQAGLLGSPLPDRTDPRLGHNLVLGSVLFGAGWGLAGLCPGPAVASIAFGGWGGALFLAAMIAGMYVAPAVRVQVDRLAAA
ncbi:DUF6691 family protein [Ruixingdingia sedimenti]|uniref:YeeE/YedE family protein n=1 Tax=Ruixingdingia sedimenti TaxID=3073604 RepID=A0ABU1F6M7_9RHOB|nr:DUF6691 family protein [Xinfangfangia sp. LG-4]MDR5652089.1 hypothetical protein [Xinfangfangia sp. LG-4]